MAEDLGAQVGAYLRMLLVRPGKARSAWERCAHGVGPGEIDYAAVAAVLGQGDAGVGGVERLCADAVRAALDGTALSAATLARFIDAFDLSPRHSVRLRDLLSGSASVRFITGNALPDLPRAIGPARHQTLALHELHTLGPDGLPAEHQTIQVIKSTVSPLAAYPYRFDTDEVVVEVVRGGQVGDMYRIADTLYGVDIVLDRPLAVDETALMHYRTTFFYRNPPPTELRRAVIGTMNDVTLWVQFHPDRLPARVWSGRWDRLDRATVIDQQPVDLDSDLSVQLRYDAITDSIVGLHWSWD